MTAVFFFAFLVGFFKFYTDTLPYWMEDDAW